MRSTNFKEQTKQDAKKIVTIRIPQFVNEILDEIKIRENYPSKSQLVDGIFQDFAQDQMILFESLSNLIPPK